MADTETQRSAPPFKFRAVQPETAEPAAPSGNPDFAYEPAPVAPSTSPRPLWDTEDVVKAGGSGLARGTMSLADVVDLPGRTMEGLAQRASQAVLGSDLPEPVSKAIRGTILPGMMPNPFAASDVSPTELMRERAPEVMDYQPISHAGRYSRTIGEFLPGAIAMPGGSLASKLATGAIAPAVASETAGYAVSGSSNPWVEPAARLAGAILGGAIGSGLENFTRRTISPGGGADPARLAAAEEMRRRGIPVTAGQATGSNAVRNVEADTAAGQMIAGATPDSQQAKAFTAATMKFLGSNAPVADQAAMNAARDRITSQLRDSVAGVNVQPNLPMSLKVAEAAKHYEEFTPSSQKIPLIRGIIDRINDGVPLSGDQLAAWRSNLGKLLYHDNQGVSDTAYMLRNAIDEAIENSMIAMGEPARVEAWRTARDQYRNLLAVEDALKVTKESGALGIVTPKDLMAALAKQDKSAIITGRRGDIGSFASDAINLLRPLPGSVQHGLVDAAVRKVGPLAATGAAGFGALQGAQFMNLSPLMTGLATGVAVAKPLYEFGKDALRSTSMSPIVQKYLENQLVNRSSDISAGMAGLRGGLSGVPSYGIEDRIGRKAGGRVGIDHDKLADQLVTAAERAKKGISKGTEQLLDLPDDHIAHALEVANRSI